MEVEKKNGLKNKKNEKLRKKNFSIVGWCIIIMSKRDIINCIFAKFLFKYYIKESVFEIFQILNLVKLQQIIENGEKWVPQSCQSASKRLF